MTESLEKLQRLVTDLETELAELPGDNPETRQLLRRLAEDIEQVLDPRTSEETISDESFMQHLQRSAQDFESSHPTVGRLFNQIIDMLGHMGI